VNFQLEFIAPDRGNSERNVDDLQAIAAETAAEFEQADFIQISLIEVTFHALIHTTYPWNNILDLFARLQQRAVVRFCFESRDSLLQFAGAQEPIMSRNDLEIELCYSKTTLKPYGTSTIFVDTKTLKDME
jgi:hypothetical protein